jgi:dephospho-CoA kinase
MIIGLVGEKLAGKDTVAEYLAEKYNAGHFRFSHILDALLEELNLEISRKNEIALGLGLRKIFGDHVLINALEQRVKRSMAAYRVVNGIRMDELDIVKSWGAKTIYITAPIQIRFERYGNRGSKVDDGAMNFQQFQELENGPSELEIPKLGAQADYKIENTGTLEELYGKVDEILRKI